MTRKPVPAARRAVAYGRRSHYDSDSMALELQEQMCRDWCERNGYTLVAWFADHGISGRKDTRPQFRAMLRLLADRSQGINALVVPWLNRLCRASGIYYRDIEPLERAGCMLIALDLPGSENPALSRLMLGVMLAIGEYYAAEAGQRMKRYNAGRVLGGLWPGGTPSYGLAWDKAAGRLVANLATAHHARRIFADFAAGRAVVAIARALNQEGVPSPRGGPWSAASVRQLLANPQYRGHLEYDGRRHPGQIERIIAPDLVAAVDARLAASRPRSHAGTRARPLSGLLRCADCGQAVLASTSTRGHNGERVYYGWRCYRYRAGACVGRYIPEPRLEALIAQRIGEALEARAGQVLTAVPEPRADHDAALAGLRRTRERTLALYKAGITNDLEQVQAEVAEIDRTIADLEQKAQPQPAVNMDMILQYADVLQDPGRWYTYPPDHRRRLYQAALRQVWVTTQPDLSIAVEVLF